MDDVTRTGSRPQPEADSGLARWKLRVLFRPDTGIVSDEWTTLDAGAPLVIGRRPPQGATGPRLRLEDDRVSRDHAELRLSPRGPFLKDLGSKNGTDVNGVRLRTSQVVPLRAGDVVRIGDSLLLLRFEDVLPADARVPELVGCSGEARRLRSALSRWASTEHPMLLLGDTGTGKGATAAAIHRLSARRGKLVLVNCAAIPVTLAEGLLFGTQRGAFTGAVERPGFFGEAHQGTLFLDEIGDLPLELQPKLLHALETQRVLPVGSSQPVRWDVRILAATNRDLEQAIGAGTFREDLYARLSAAVLRLPPLAVRREDVLLLFSHFFGPGFRPSPQLAEALLLYGWPRNVREVGNVVSQLKACGEAEVLTGLTASRSSAPEPESPPAPAARSPRPAPPTDPAADPGSRPKVWKNGDPPPSPEEVAALLQQYHGNLNRIEQEIGYSRRQFRRWIDQYGLDLETYRGPRRSS